MDILSQEEIDALLEVVDESDDTRPKNHIDGIVKSISNILNNEFQIDLNSIIDVKQEDIKSILQKDEILTSEYAFKLDNHNFIFTFGVSSSFKNFISNHYENFENKDKIFEILPKWVFFYTFDSIASKKRNFYLDNDTMKEIIEKNRKGRIDFLFEALQKLEQPLLHKEYILKNLNFLVSDNKYFNPLLSEIILDTFFGLEIDEKIFYFWVKLEKLNTISKDKLDLLLTSKIIIDDLSEFFKD